MHHWSFGYELKCPFVFSYKSLQGIKLSIRYMILYVHIWLKWNKYIQMFYVSFLVTIFTKKGYNAHQNWFILSFYIVLPFFIIFTIMIMKRNEMRKSRNKESAEYEG